MQFSGGRIDMDESPLLHTGPLYWTFLERSGSYFFRVWDTLSTRRDAFDELPAYPVDAEWAIPVMFSPAEPGSVIVLDDIQGMRRQNVLAGFLSGSWRDTAFTLVALDGESEGLFLLIEDATTDIETYPGGRYLYVPLPDSSGRTVIDFNRAFIPPCAFTEFATCLLPPAENRLPFAVRAGEMNVPH